MKMAWTLALALVIALLPGAAEACSVCYGGLEESRTAFIVTTALLAGLPLAMIGSLAFWIRSRVRAMEQSLPDRAATPTS